MGQLEGHDDLHYDNLQGISDDNHQNISWNPHLTSFHFKNGKFTAWIEDHGIAVDCRKLSLLVIDFELLFHVAQSVQHVRS
jgi:hypothetical protein